MIRILSVIPFYDASGKLVNINVSIELVLATGEKGNANFVLEPDQIDFSAISESIKSKLQNGLV